MHTGQQIGISEIKQTSGTVKNQLKANSVLVNYLDSAD